MMLLPYEHLIIKTYLSPEEAQQRLVDVVEPRKLFRFGFQSGHKSYQGEVNQTHFNITRVIHYRNSFLPIIKGEIRSELDGSSIHITMHPHILVLAFMAIWFGGVGCFFFNLLGAIILSILQPNSTQSVEASALLFPTMFFIFGYALVTGGFKFESVKSKAFFQKLFEAHQVTEFGIWQVNN